MKEIKTVADIRSVLDTEWIPTVNDENGTCLFCGARLKWRVIDQGQNKIRQYFRCYCPAAQVAYYHNLRQKNLARREKLNRHDKLLQAEEERRQKEAKKPMTITAEQMFCVVATRILPGVEPVYAISAINTAMCHAGFTDGDCKARLLAYAEKNGFAEGLKKASQEIFCLVKSQGIDISDIVKILCTKYKVPEALTL